jgi:hypothetical protein
MLSKEVRWLALDELTVLTVAAVFPEGVEALFA